MKLSIPKINGESFGQEFARRRALRKIIEVMDSVGPENLEWMVKSDKDIESVLSRKQLNTIMAKAQIYSWVGDIITTDDLVAAQPEWVLEIIEKYGNSGKKWMVRQLEWLEKLFKQAVESKSESKSNTAANTEYISAPPIKIVASGSPTE